MRKGQQQIRCSSDVNIADRIDSRLQIQGPPPQKMKGQRGQLRGRGPEMVKSGGDEAVRHLQGDDTGIHLQGKGALHLLDGDVALLLPLVVALLLPLVVADLPLLLDEGLLLHLLVDDLHPRDDILPLSSVATAPHLCLHRRGRCQALLQSAHPQGPSGVPPGPQSAEVLLLKGGALLPPHHRPDTGGAPCCLLAGKAGIPDPLPTAGPHPL